ncbi:MAG TPA: hypothetical protein VGN17_21320 [Bryobacteraceae bacterium]|jgi:hypothetical protein
MKSAYTPWPLPDPQAIVGMNSVMVYGENIQVAAGLNHQLAVGSNLQVCVNPAVLVEMLKAPGSELFSVLAGSGLGGNMQFTIGSSASVVWGRKFDIHVGPDDFKVDNDPDKSLVSQLLCAAIGVVAIVHCVAYGLIASDDENGRATEVIVIQILMDLLIGAFMLTQMAGSQISRQLDKAWKAMTVFPLWDTKSELERWATLLELAVILGAVITPPIIMGKEENHFQAETQDRANETSEFPS